MNFMIEELKPYLITAKCRCGGTMETTGVTLTCNPPVYPHQCTECKKIENFEKCYPYTHYQKVKTSTNFKIAALRAEML